MSTDKDDRYRFIIVALSFGLLLCSPSTAYSNGVFLLNFKTQKAYDIGLLTWVMSCTNFMHNIGGFIGSFLSSVTSCRTVAITGGCLTFLGFVLGSVTTNVHLLLLTYGMVLGVGRGFCFSATTINLGYWFKEDTSLASGLSYAGVGIGMLVHPRLVQAFADWYGVDGAQMLMGALTFHSCVWGLLLRPSRYERHRKLTQLEEKRLRKADSYKDKLLTALKAFHRVVLKNFSFLFFVMSIFLLDMAFQSIIIFLPEFYTRKGATPQEAALAASLTGVGGLMARLLVGVAGNDRAIGPVLIVSGNCGIMGILTLFLPVIAESVTGRFIFAFCAGTYISCLFVLLGPITLQRVGLKNIPYGFAFLLLCASIDNLTGPPIINKVREVSGSYYASFILAACFFLGGSACGFLSEMLYKPVEDTNKLDIEEIDVTSEKICDSTKCIDATEMDTLKEDGLHHSEN